MNTKDKQGLIKYLNGQILMSLGTSDGEGNLWAASVYYLFDDDLIFYFLSSPKTIHCKNISKNKNVSGTIADSSQKLASEKVGLQFSGVCKRVTGIDQVTLVLKMWRRLGKGSEGLKTKDVLSKGSSRFYKITPKKIKYMNKKLYDSGYGEFKL